MNSLSETLLKPVVKIDQLLKLCWLGILGSQGIYVFIAYKLPHESASHHQSEMIFISIFSLIGIMFMVMSLWLRHVLISPRAVARYLDDKGPLWIYKFINSSYRYPHGGMNDMPSDLDDTERKMLSYAIKSQMLQIILWGMLNSTAVFGLLLSILLSQPSITIAFVVPVFVVALAQYPDTRRLLEAGLREKDLQN